MAENINIKQLEAKEKLDEMKLSSEERKEHKAFLKRLMDIASEQYTKMADAEDLLKKGKEQGILEKEKEAVLGFYNIGVSEEVISKALTISLKKVQQIIKEQ